MPPSDYMLMSSGKPVSVHNNYREANMEQEVIKVKLISNELDLGLFFKKFSVRNH